MEDNEFDHTAGVQLVEEAPYVYLTSKMYSSDCSANHQEEVSG